MKKILLLSLMVVLVFASTSFAAEKYALGMGNIALKVDYINFTEDAFEDLELENGIYVGLEGYYAIYPNLYLGMEAGWAGSENDGEIENVDVDFEVTFIPIELNLKYVFELDPSWNIGIGAGISYSYFEVDFDEVGDLDLDLDADDWLFGGQLFADVNYKFNKEWFMGINAKYQFTDDLEFDEGDTDTSADNWRIGAQIGYMW